jgi:hypothetical protein
MPCLLLSVLFIPLSRLPPLLPLSLLVTAREITGARKASAKAASSEDDEGDDEE